MSKLSSCLITLFTLLTLVSGQGCFTSSLPHVQYIDADLYYYDMQVDQAEQFIYVTGLNRDGNLSMVAKFSLADVIFVWFKSFETIGETAVSGRAIALYEPGAKLAVWHEDNDDKGAIQISLHDLQSGSALLPFYRLINEINMRFSQLDGQFTFDSQGNLWLVQIHEYGLGFDMFDKDRSVITKLIVTDTEITIGYRKFMLAGSIGSIYRMPQQNTLFFGGAVAVIKDQQLMTLYKLDPTTSTISNSDLYEINLLYWNGGFFNDDKAALYIEKMHVKYDNTNHVYYLYFVTEMREKGKYGLNGSHVLCETTWTDNTYTTIDQLAFLRLYYPTSDEKVIGAILPGAGSGKKISGFSRGDEFNTNHYFWLANFSTGKVNFFQIYPNHYINAAYLSLTKPSLQLNPLHLSGVTTGYVAGYTDEFLLNEDGQSYSMGKLSGLITSLRIGDETCGTMTTTYTQITAPPANGIAFAFYNGVNSFAPTSQLINEAPAQILEQYPSLSLQISQQNIKDSFQACSTYSQVLTASPGFFPDKVIFTDSVDSYPLACTFQGAVATSTCSQNFNIYTINQISLPFEILQIAVIPSKIIINQPVGIPDGDYPITVTGSIPNTNGGYFFSSFTFNLIIRQSTNPTTCTSTIPCSMTTTLVSLSAASISNKLYYYSFSEGSVTPIFTTSVHALCSSSDIVYDYTITPSNSALDTSFISMAADGTISWYSEVDQGDSQFFIQITGSIDLTTMGQVVTAQTSFTLVCRSMCASSIVQVSGSPVQELFVYTQGDNPRVEKLILFDGQGGSCLQTYSLKMIERETLKELPQEIIQGPLVLAFQPDTWTLYFYALGTTVEFVELELQIFNSYGQLKGSLLYKIEILVNNPPIFTQDLSKTTVKVPCQTNTKWIYKLPDTIDPEDDPVGIQVNFEENIKEQILYSRKQQSLYLNKTSSQPPIGIYQANFTLFDTRNAQTLYTVNLQVVCKPRNQTSQVVNSTEVDEEWEEYEEETFTSEVTFQKPKIPIPRLKSFSASGKLALQWSQKMKMLPLSKKFTFTVGRTLQSSESWNEQEEESLPSLEVKYIQNSDKNWIKPQELDFEYRVIWLNEQTSQMDIKFEKPQSASAEVGREDILILTFNDTHAFQSMTGESVPLNYQLTIKVPRQFGGDHFDDEEIEAISETSKNIARVTLVTSIILQGVANQLLSLIKNLTVVIHMFILALPYPVNTQKFFAALFPMVTFDVIPADQWIYEPLWGFDQVEPEGINTQFEELGYENILFIMNLGSMFLILIWIPIKAFIISFAYSTLPKKNFWPLPKIRKSYRTLPSAFFQEIESTYLIVVIMCLVNILNWNYSTTVWQTNTLFAMGFFLVYVITPIHIVLIYSIKIHYFRDQEEYRKFNSDFFETHGSLIESINVCRVGKYNSIFFVFTKFFYYFTPVAGIFIFIDKPLWAIFCFLINELAITSIFLHYWPYQTLKDNLQMFYEKVVLLIVIYFLFTFTQWTDFDVKEMAGSLVIYFIILQSAFLIVILLLDGLKQCYTEGKRKRYLIKERQKYRQKVQQEIKVKLLQESSLKSQKTMLIIDKSEDQSELTIRSVDEQQKVAEEDQNKKNSNISKVNVMDQLQQIYQGLRSNHVIVEPSSTKARNPPLLSAMQTNIHYNYALNIRQELISAVEPPSQQPTEFQKPRIIYQKEDKKPLKTLSILKQQQDYDEISDLDFIPVYTPIKKNDQIKTFYKESQW